MGAYVLQRLLWALPTFLGITVLTFGLLRLAPGDPFTGSLEQLSQAGGQTSAGVEAVRKAHGLDRPLWRQYGEWVGRVARLDFGRSLQDQRPVREKLLEALPRTAGLTGAALLLALLVGIPLGVAAAARRGSWGDRALTVVTYALPALPTFWVGVMLLAYLASPRGLELFPLHGLATSGRAGAGDGGLARALDVVWHAVLPVLCLAYGALAVLCRHVRSGMLAVLGEDFVRTARAKGLPERLVLTRHALRPALLPLVTWVGLALPQLVGGSVVVEQVFGVPGMGLLAFDALLARDYPTVMGVTTGVALLTLLSTLVTDIAYAAIDPRIRLGEARR